MKVTNIIIFSSGVSERRGLLQWLCSELEAFGCRCFCWRDLFTNANHSDSIALLPMLIKKIPTFDFAILICEGHDKVQLIRNGQLEETNSMRDNVLFEIGLCSVALGLNKVILLADETVRLPEDLTGLNGKLAIKRVMLPIAWEN
ncbi:MAG: nucleotide-binding protein, partial [Clostridia bacterium]|nr:nucleotide-binding protein [Clostridia bacterium]